MWSPYLKCEISQIESVQRAFSRFVCYDSSMSYQERCTLLEILPLSFRREIADLVFCFKCLKGVINVDFSEELVIAQPVRPTRSMNNGCLLKDSLCRTEHFKSSYFKRIPILWNELPGELRNCDSVHVFKAKLTRFYFNRLALHYNTFNSCTWTRYCRCYGYYH